jgi:hypothetical protein
MEINNNISIFQSILKTGTKNLVPDNSEQKPKSINDLKDNNSNSNIISNNMKTEIYKDTGDTVYKTYRNKTLLFQFPTTDILKLRAYIQNLNK